MTADPAAGMLRHAMQFGLYPPLTQRGGNLDRLWQDVVAAAQAAERGGFASCLFGEHHQGRDGYFTSPLVLAGLLATHTRTLRVGTCLLLLPLYHPVRVAEDAALVDLVSGGRLILGLGPGYLPADFAAFGIAERGRFSRLEEGVHIIRQAWTEPRFSFAGRHFGLDEISILPKPRQQPHPPIWLGGSSEAGVRRAARLGEGWIGDGMQGRDAIAHLASVYRRECAALGKRGHIALMRQAWIGKTRDEALSEYGRAILGLYRFIWRNRALYAATEDWALQAGGPEELALERVPLDRFVVGTAAEAVEQVAAWGDLGVEHLILGFHHPDGPAASRVNEMIRDFGEQVVARFG